HSHYSIELTNILRSHSTSVRAMTFNLDEVLAQSTIDDIPDKELRLVLQSYLLNINNNLLLSREYSVGVLDWFDFEPFYVNKLMLDKAQLVSDTSTIISS